jgi:uncharacterized protein YbgA (DUF1722 family)/uncharacterized protein YbbK (DUF523 family)
LLNKMFMEHPIKIGISSCLLGENVRFDSGHKKNSYITGILSSFFDFIPFCPEVSIGLGIPREPIRLVSIENEIRCVGTKSSTLDVTEKLYAMAESQKAWHEDLCGYILKKNSPSCGMERVKVYKEGIPFSKGAGLYAERLIANFPNLPVEEEGRLEDSRLRENFIQRVYIFSRWKTLVAKEPSLSNLQEFHSQHKYIFMSHSQENSRELGSLLSGNNNLSIEELTSTYLFSMTKLLKKTATRNNHVNTLQHIQGYLKSKLDSEDKKELHTAINDYQKGLLPLIVPITLLRHYFRHHPNKYITNSFYMQPHPGEMMLLNNL